MPPAELQEDLHSVGALMSLDAKNGYAKSPASTRRYSGKLSPFGYPSYSSLKGVTALQSNSYCKESAPFVTYVFDATGRLATKPTTYAKARDLVVSAHARRISDNVIQLVKPLPDDAVLHDSIPDGLDISFINLEHLRHGMPLAPVQNLGQSRIGIPLQGPNAATTIELLADLRNGESHSTSALMRGPRQEHGHHGCIKNHAVERTAAKPGSTRTEQGRPHPARRANRITWAKSESNGEVSVDAVRRAQPLHGTAANTVLGAAYAAARDAITAPLARQTSRPAPDGHKIIGPDGLNMVRGRPQPIASTTPRIRTVDRNNRPLPLRLHPAQAAAAVRAGRGEWVDLPGGWRGLRLLRVMLPA